MGKRKTVNEKIIKEAVDIFTAICLLHLENKITRDKKKQNGKNKRI
jgi:hypothetical protein